jgi:type 1 glutamine amidotransferase
VERAQRTSRGAAAAVTTAAAIALLTAASCDSAPSTVAPSPSMSAGPGFDVLVFTRTTGFWHDSIPAAVDAIRALGSKHGFSVTATEDESTFTDDQLARYATVVFVSTTGDPLGSQAAKDAFERYVEDGGGFVGIHAAADSGYEWPWYGGLVGAYFQRHSSVEPATVTVEDPTHPATTGLPASFPGTDEWYEFRTSPRPVARVLTSLGVDRPLTWCHDYRGGRAFYTAVGHTVESFQDEHVRRLLLGGILSTAGVVPADCTPSTSSPT